MNTWLIDSKILVIGIILAITCGVRRASPADDEKAVAALDKQYQAAVEKNDADTWIAY